MLAGSEIPRELTSVPCSPGSTASAAEERAEAGSDKHVGRNRRYFHLCSLNVLEYLNTQCSGEAASRPDRVC